MSNKYLRLFYCRLTSGLRRVRSESSEEKCGETEECVAQENCSQFQTKRRQLNALSDKSSQEYSDLLKELKQKVNRDEYEEQCTSHYSFILTSDL